MQQKPTQNTDAATLPSIAVELFSRRCGVFLLRAPRHGDLAGQLIRHVDGRGRFEQLVFSDCGWKLFETLHDFAERLAIKPWRQDLEDGLFREHSGKKQLDASQSQK